MAGKWNIKISGIKINNTIYPVIEIYFNLGYAVNVNDVLNFGTITEFGYDLQIRTNAIGTGYSFIGCGGFSKPHDLNFEPLTVIDANGLSLIQTTSNGDNFQTVTVHLRYLVDSTLYYIAFCYSNPYGFGSSEAFSPLCVLHDEFTNKIIATTSNLSAGTIIQSNGRMLFKLNDVIATNTLPIVFNDNRNVSMRADALLNNVLEKINPSDSDPYAPNTNPGGGGGETQPSDSITDPALPTISSVDTGFITLYKPSISQLNNLASWMWGSLDVDIFKRVMQSPMDAILGLSILPGIVPSGSSSSVKIGNVDSGVSMPKVSSQYVKFDCGSITVKRKWGAFLDYSPYTKTYIYLPFIGIRSIETDSIMGVSTQVKYNIDLMSGACCAFVIANGTTLYTFIGQCSCSVPVTGRDWTNMVNGVLGAVSGVASAAGSAASGNILGAVSGVASAATSALSAKPTIEHSGNMGGMGGLMGIKRPYFIIERPVQAVPGYQNSIIGYPSFVYKSLSDLRGYTEFEQIHLEGLPCTSEEQDEIENILLTGVIL